MTIIQRQSFKSLFKGRALRAFQFCGRAFQFCGRICKNTVLGICLSSQYLV